MYDELIKRIYEQNKAVGWWDGDPCLWEKLQLVMTEISEATEGERKDLMDDHLPHRKMGEVELADALIRLLDLAGRLGIKLDSAVNDESKYLEALRLSLIPQIEGFSVGRRHFGIVDTICNASQELINGHGEDQRAALISPIIVIEAVSDSFGYDLYGALEEKLAYNAKRSDHTREARAAQNGKAF